MHHLSSIASAGRHFSKVAVLGTVSTVIAAAGTTWLITGSTDPNVWVADYAHALKCAVADPALSARCYTVAAEPAVNVQAPERSAPEQSPPPSAEPSPTVPPAGPPAAPAPHQSSPPAAEAENDDGYEADS